MTAHSASPVMNEPPMAPIPCPNHTPPTSTRMTPMMTRAFMAFTLCRRAVLRTAVAFRHALCCVCGRDHAGLKTAKDQAPRRLHERRLFGVLDQLVHLDPRTAVGVRFDAQIPNEL